MKKSKRITIRKTISYLLIVFQCYFYAGCYITQPLQKTEHIKPNTRVTKYVTVDSKEVDCSNDLEGFATIQNDYIVRKMADYSRQDVPLEGVKEMYTEQFTWTGTVVTIVFVITIPIGIYALAIRHALNDPRR